MSVLKKPVNAEDHQQGNTEASMILVEYGDFECPYCRRAYPLVKKLMQAKGNDLLFVYRHFPLKMIHANAYGAAVAAEAAGKQDKFWEMHQLIFENQEKLSAGYFLYLADKIGLELGQFTRDSKSKGVQSKVNSDFESGIRSGVNGTPTFFLNGSPISTYNETYESLLDAIEMTPGIHHR